MLMMYPPAHPLPHPAAYQPLHPPPAAVAPAQPTLLPAHDYNLAVYNAWRQQQPPPPPPPQPSLPRSSRKRGHRALDVSLSPLAVQENGSVEGDPLLQSRADERGSKRQEVQLNVPVVSASSFDSADGLPASPQLRPLSPVVIARSPSPAGSDASMTDAEAASLLEPEQQQPDEEAAPPSSADADSADSSLSPLFQRGSTISPVIPLPSSLLALYKSAAASSSSFPFAPHRGDEEQPDPSKQLILYQPAPSPRSLLPSPQRRRGREKQATAQQPWNGNNGDDAMLDNSQ